MKSFEQGQTKLRERAIQQKYYDAEIREGGTHNNNNNNNNNEQQRRRNAGEDDEYENEVYALRQQCAELADRLREMERAALQKDHESGGGSGSGSGSGRTMESKKNVEEEEEEEEDAYIDVRITN